MGRRVATAQQVLDGTWKLYLPSGVYHRWQEGDDEARKLSVVISSKVERSLHALRLVEMTKQIVPPFGGTII